MLFLMIPNISLTRSWCHTDLKFKLENFIKSIVKTK